MVVNVRLFAGAAQIAGTSQVSLVIEPNSGVSVCVADVVNQLMLRIPQLQDLIRVSRWAVEDQFVGMEFRVDVKHTLAMIPPVSGG